MNFKNVISTLLLYLIMNISQAADTSAVDHIYKDITKNISTNDINLLIEYWSNLSFDKDLGANKCFSREPGDLEFDKNNKIKISKNGFLAMVSGYHGIYVVLFDSSHMVNPPNIVIYNSNTTSFVNLTLKGFSEGIYLGFYYPGQAAYQGTTFRGFYIDDEIAEKYKQEVNQCNFKYFAH